MVSTLNPDDEEWAYKYQRYDLKIPKGFLKQAKKKGLDKKWVTFRFGDKRATQRTEADSLEERALVRMGRCRLPATSKVIKIIKHRLKKFDTNSWIYNNRPNSGAKNTSEDQTYDELVCTAVIDHFVCDDPNVSDPYNDPGCVYIGSECIQWEYVEEDDDPGGGGGIGGDDGDPCSPCEPDMPCVDDGAMPQGCSAGFEIDPEPCEGDPVYQPEIRPTDGSGIEGGRHGWTRSEGNKYHAGLDIKSPVEGPLHSMFDGQVWSTNTSFEPNEYKEGDSDFGNYIIMESTYEGETIYVLFAHLNEVHVDENDTITAGQMIGLTGKTGNAAASNNDPNLIPHVHIEVRTDNGQPFYDDWEDHDPEEYLKTQFDEDGDPIYDPDCNYQ